METANSPALLLLNLPPSALAGIDLLSFTTTPRFRGVKDLPPGFHFAFSGTSAAFSERHGIWFYIPHKRDTDVTPLFVAKWNPETESLEAESDEAERLRWRANLGSIWREGLTPYRQTSSKGVERYYDEDEGDVEEEINDWPSLTSQITPALLSRITAGDSTRWHLTSASSASRDLEDIPGLSPTSKEVLQSSHELHLLPIDLKQTWPDNATGRQRTEYAQDRSWALSTHNPSDILGELQFTFLMILTLNNFSCLEQWKRLLTLILTSKSAISQNPDFFITALSTLRLQLQHCKDAEGGLIDLADDSGSLLKSLLVRFRKGLESLPSTDTSIQDVTDELDDLEDFLRTEHAWQFGGDFARSGVLELEDGEQVRMVESSAFDEDDETGEFAPQIVELTAEQARLLDITPEDARALEMKLGRATLRDEGNIAGVVQDGEGDDSNDDDGESEEETQDLEEMDSRY